MNCGFTSVWLIYTAPQKLWSRSHPLPLSLVWRLRSQLQISRWHAQWMPGWLYNVSMFRMSLASPSCLCSFYKAVLDTFDLIFSDILVFLLWFFYCAYHWNWRWGCPSAVENVYMWLSFDIMLVSSVLSSCLLNDLYMELKVYGSLEWWNRRKQSTAVIWRMRAEWLWLEKNFMLVCNFILFKITKAQVCNCSRVYKCMESSVWFSLCESLRVGSYEL